MYKLSSDYKEHASGRYRFKRMTNRGAFFGELRVYKSGRTIYLAARLADEQVHVMQNAWALDAALDGWLRIMNAQYVGIAVSKRPSRNISPKNVAAYYVIRTQDYFAFRRKTPWNFNSHTGMKRRGGSRQWLIDLMFMRCDDMLTEAQRLRWTLGMPGTST